MRLKSIYVVLLLAAAALGAPAATSATVVRPNPAEDTFYFTLGGPNTSVRVEDPAEYVLPGERLVEGGGSGWPYDDNPGQWFYYEPPNADPRGPLRAIDQQPPIWWYNQWYYDHDTVENHYKIVEGYIYFEPHASPDPGSIPPEDWSLLVALNWSTPAYSEQDDSAEAPPGFEEEEFIRRAIVVDATDPAQFPNDVDLFLARFSYVVPNYNPEWVSIDIRGYNIRTPEMVALADGTQIPGGFFTHECIPVPEPASFTLMGLGLGALAIRYRRKRH